MKYYLILNDRKFYIPGDSFRPRQTDGRVRTVSGNAVTECSFSVPVLRNPGSRRFLRDRKVRTKQTGKEYPFHISWNYVAGSGECRRMRMKMKTPRNRMVFRGVIFQSLRKFSDPMALFISAGLFSLAHMSVVKIPYTFLMGLCIGYFVMKTNSLLTGMAIHLVNNAYVLTKELIGSNMPAELLPIFQDISSIALIILGFVALLLLVNRYSGMFTLRPNSGYLRVYEQIRSFAAAPAMTITGVLLVMLTVYPYIAAIG